MITRNQCRALDDYYERGDHIYTAAERWDVDYEQLQQIVSDLDRIIPGRGIDYNAVLARDPIASDSLVLHCNHTLRRFDQIYIAAFERFHRKRVENHIRTKRTTVNTPPDYAHPSYSDGEFKFESPDGGSDKVETTTSPPSQESLKVPRYRHESPR